MPARKLYYATITEYAAMFSIPLTKKQAEELGRLASRYSRERSVAVGKAPNTRFGTVNAYRNDILIDCFSHSTEKPHHGKNTKNQDRQPDLFAASYPHS